VNADRAIHEHGRHLNNDPVSETRGFYVKPFHRNCIGNISGLMYLELLIARLHRPLRTRAGAFRRVGTDEQLHAFPGLEGCEDESLTSVFWFWYVLRGGGAR
jgi:hypothetical protein